MSSKNIKIILQGLLLSVIVVIPFIRTDSLYFPFVSGKVYLFRFLVCLAFFFFAWLLLKDKENGKTLKEIFLPFKNILVSGLIFFFLAQVLVSFLGVSPEYSLFSSIERQDGVVQYGFWILYFIMLFFAFKTEKDWKILFSVFISTGFLVSFYAWLNLATQSRLYGNFGNPSYLAAYLLFVIGFCYIVIIKNFFKEKYINILFFVLSVFFAITLFFTQTRGAYLGLAFAIFLFCFLSAFFLRPAHNVFGKADAGGKQNPEGNLLDSYGASKNLARSSVVVLVLGIICVIALFSAKETDFIKNRPMLARVTEVVEFWEIGSIRERVLNWQIALTAFKEKPIFGYGPENFGTAFNKYYDYRIGRGDPWFDRTHNQIIEQLATGGIVLFSFFIFFLSSVYYVIFRISKKEKILSFVLASVFSAYIIQGGFLFDTLPVYLGLFPFLAFIVALQQTPISADKKPPISADKKVFKNVALSVVGILCVFGIYATVLVPYMANASAFRFLAFSSNEYYIEAKPFAERAFSIKSPYTFLEIRKRIGWVFLGTLEQEKKFTEKEVNEIGDIYDFLTPELEKFLENRSFDPQIYYILARTYRLGSEKLGKNDLEKAKIVLEKAFEYSDLRIEYYNEIAHVLLAEGRFEEGESLLKDYVNRVSSFDYFPSLMMGHYYYVAEKYDLAMENYKTAKEFDYNFNEDPAEYSRYIAVAEQTKEYQEIVEMAKDRLEKYGPEADTYFNIALGYYYLEEREKALEFFQKALELDQEQYQQYSHFFEIE